MPIQRSRFHSSIRPPPNQASRTEIVEPIAGLNRQRSALNLRPGETPFSQNWVMNDRYIEPRSGLSQYGGSTSLTSTPLTLALIHRRNNDGGDAAFLLSSNTMRVLRTVDSTPSWDGIAMSGIATILSSETNAFYDVVGTQWESPSATIFENAVFTNRDAFPFTMGQAASARTFTEAFSLLSYARHATAFDERLVFFHTANDEDGWESAGSYFPTRVVWSARGDQSDFTTGGFQDLVDMRGAGTGVLEDNDRLLLYSDKETWAGRPRRDSFAFDFFQINREKGLPEDYRRTLQNTEAGTIWLGEGFQFQRLVGNEVRAFGDKVRDLIKDEMREWELCWSLYNPDEHTYAFFYSDTTGEYPTKALFLRTDTIQPTGVNRDDGTWFLQDFGTIQLNAGVALAGRMTVVSSNATVYRLRSDQTNDAGTAVDCRWRSHGLRSERDSFPYEALQEFWLDYDYDSATTSTLSLFQSADNGASFTAISNASLTSGVNSAFIPVTAAAARNQMFELRLNDGTKPRLSKMQLKLRGYTGRYAG